MIKINSKKPRTLKQKWASERCFIHKGQLTEMGHRLRQIALASSTLIGEAAKLLSLSNGIEEVLENWDNEASREISWKRFQKSNKP